MSNKTKYYFVPDYECSEGLIWAVKEEEMLCDIKKLLSEYYIATFTSDGTALNISFNNGQKFCVSVRETTAKSA